MKIYKICTAEKYSLLVNDITLLSDNPLRFRKILLEWIYSKIMTNTIWYQSRSSKNISLIIFIYILLYLYLFFPVDEINNEIQNELEKKTELWKKVIRGNLFYEASKEIYNFRNFQAIRSFG